MKTETVKSGKVYLNVVDKWLDTLPAENQRTSKNLQK